MENYLEYLDKLQKEMNLDEKVSRNKLEEYQKLYSKYNALASLFGFIAMLGAFSTLIVLRYSIGGSILTIILALFCGGLLTEFGGKADHYRESSRNERDKVYNLNYSNIKNLIINDGDEHMKQLATWWRMCELSDEDKEKYADLLRIVNDVCREYVLLWR
jgi:hypothetical protein